MKVVTVHSPSGILGISLCLDDKIVDTQDVEIRFNDEGEQYKSNIIRIK